MVFLFVGKYFTLRSNQRGQLCFKTGGCKELLGGGAAPVHDSCATTLFFRVTVESVPGSACSTQRLLYSGVTSLR